MKYLPAGYIYRDGIDQSDFDDDRIRPLVKCDGCGALINGGGLSREKHDNFHAALANLFDTLADIQESQVN